MTIGVRLTGSASWPSLFLVSTAAAAAAVIGAAPAAASPRLVAVATGLHSPVLVTAPAGDFGRTFIVEQTGRIRIARNGTVLPRPFLDLSSKISCCGERGLLGLAFHPAYLTNGRFFVNYTDLAGNTVIAEYRATYGPGADPDLANVSSARVVLTQAQPFPNHNGGNLVFGPNDGYLYIGLGDGGSSGDPAGNGQNGNTFLGKLLRIDVDGRDAGKGYGVPDDNPYSSGVGPPQPGTLPLPEIWALGLRNPWRFSFDRVTGDLWIGDVGQDAWEEVDFAPAESPGGKNYGWNTFEGNHCFNESSGCSRTGLTLPILEYGHDANPSRCAVTGGFVYRGALAPSVAGRYVFGDYCSGEMLSLLEVRGAALDLRNETSAWRTLTGGKISSLSSFGEDGAGELYVCDYDSGTVYRLEDDAPSPVRIVPIVLDADGANGAHFTTELTLTDTGAQGASVKFDFVPAASLGPPSGGSFTVALAAGEQRTIPDAVDFLRQQLPIPPSQPGMPLGGSLRLTFSGIAAADVSAVARTTTAAGAGRAGLASSAPRPGDAMGDGALVFGLRESAADRSNLALENAGTTGPVTLRVTLRNGTGAGTYVWPETVVLPPGGWRQLDRVLVPAGFASGWALVERVAGSEPFWAYGVTNDNVTNDGSLAEPIRPIRPAEAQVVPAVVETPSLDTELIVLNPTAFPGRAELTYVESLDAGGGRFTVTETLAAGEQKILPSFLDHLRQSVAGFGPRGGAFAGSLTVQLVVDKGTGGANVLVPAGGAAAARVLSPAAGGGSPAGRYGLFYRGLGLSETAWDEAWVHGLRQTEGSRSNLALVNAGSTASGPVVLRVDLFDGDAGGRLVRSVTVPLEAGSWSQLNQPLAEAGVTHAWARVTRVSGASRFIAYGVVNDGASPGKGTGDGSYLAMENVR